MRKALSIFGLSFVIIVGCSDNLKEDVESLGEDKFTREILYFCPSRGVASYIEAREQFERKVLLRDDYYNGIINVRVGGSKILREGVKDSPENPDT